LNNSSILAFAFAGFGSVVVRSIITCLEAQLLSMTYQLFYLWDSEWDIQLLDLAMYRFEELVTNTNVSI
jgi:hypothetical protein